MAANNTARNAGDGITLNAGEKYSMTMFPTTRYEQVQTQTKPNMNRKWIFPKGLDVRVGVGLGNQVVARFSNALDDLNEERYPNVYEEYQFFCECSCEQNDWQHERNSRRGAFKPTFRPSQTTHLTDLELAYLIGHISKLTECWDARRQFYRHLSGSVLDSMSYNGISVQYKPDDDLCYLIKYTRGNKTSIVTLSRETFDAFCSVGKDTYTHLKNAFSTYNALYATILNHAGFTLSKMVFGRMGGIKASDFKRKPDSEFMDILYCMHSDFMQLGYVDSLVEKLDSGIHPVSVKSVVVSVVSNTKQLLTHHYINEKYRTHRNYRGRVVKPSGASVTAAESEDEIEISPECSTIPKPPKNLKVPKGYSLIEMATRRSMWVGKKISPFCELEMCHGNNCTPECVRGQTQKKQRDLEPTLSSDCSTAQYRSSPPKQRRVSLDCMTTGVSVDSSK